MEWLCFQLVKLCPDARREGWGSKAWCLGPRVKTNSPAVDGGCGCARSGGVKLDSLDVLACFAGGTDVRPSQTFVARTSPMGPESTGVGGGVPVPISQEHPSQNPLFD